MSFPSDVDPKSELQRGNAFYVARRFAEAAECYREALRRDPRELNALNNLGAALADQGQLAEAVVCYRQVLQQQPGRPDTLYNLGNALRALDQFEDAVAAYAQALQNRPDWAEAHNNLGIALLRLARYTESTSSLRRALELKPGYPLALVNLGLALAESGRLAEALACYEQALRLEPENPDAHRNRALAWLLQGDWTRGFPEYQWRWRCADFRPLGFSQPLWDGSPLNGRRILLYTEQGFGDTLQFIRFAALVKDRGGTVILAAPERLHPILKSAAGIDHLIPREGVLPEFDVHFPLMSLPALFATTPSGVPGEVPYLSPEPERVERWRRELESVDGLRVGIAWHGNPTTLHYNGRRSIPLAAFEPLARVEPVRLISLQIGPGAEQVAALAGRFPLLDLSDRLDESAGAFLDTAAVISQLDLVVTCDTSIAHLAGALGVEVWIVLPSVPDWRWMLDRADTPWYPQARLFRQEIAGRWDEPFQQIAERLRARAARRRAALTFSVDITPGELIDRISILEIKNRRIAEPEKLRNIREELATLSAARDELLRTSNELGNLTSELVAVNESIWDAEDAIRRCEARRDFGPHFVELARSIYRQNDARAALKRRINDHFGCVRQEEKSYPGHGS